MPCSFSVSCVEYLSNKSRGGGVDKFDIVASSLLDTDEVDMWEMFALIQTARCARCAVASHISNVVELTGVLHIHCPFSSLGW